MKRTTRIRSGDSSLHVTVTGDGQKLVFFNGLGATQAAWKRVTQRLKGRYEIVTFDFRGHGKSSRSTRYSFASFLDDVDEIMRDFGSDRPVIVGWSMGADLAMWHATTHPGTIAGLVIVDGAIPVPQRLVEDSVALRRSLNRPALKLAMAFGRLTSYGYSLSGDQIAEMTLEVDERRQELLAAYEKVDFPIAVVLAENTGGGDSPRAQRINRLWRAGAMRLAAHYPSIPLRWMSDTHLLPFRRPAELAQVIDDFCIGLKAQG